METAATIQALRERLHAVRMDGKRIGFVPTMGYLHEGHLSLVRLAKERGVFVVASIFVNPLQFNNPQDFEKYPQNLERDSQLLREQGVDLLFTPNADAFYPADFQTKVTVEKLSAAHEGEFRPGHFTGVTTVVSMLFNLVQPDRAVFGEKDFQQLRIIEQLVQDMKYDIEIVRGPLVREADGLAMSSRNVRLSPAGRVIAPIIYKGLCAGRERYRTGERSSAQILAAARAVICAQPELQLEYLRLIDERTLAEGELAGESSRLVVAAYLDGVRLIDTMAIS